MKCGSKCFIVEVELNGEVKTERINARTPVDARKVTRGKYGVNAVIRSAVAEKRKP